MNILVTGGAGFIGSHFVKYLLSARPNDDVYCMDSLTYAGNINNLSMIMKRPKFHFIRASITDNQSVLDAFEQNKFDVVVNFAAESHVDNSIRSPGVFLDTNIMGTMVLMEACRNFGICRYHQVSTDEVYGDLPLDRPDMLFSEDSPIKPSSPYSASKAGADLLVQAYGRTFSLPITVSRCSNNYGPNQFPEKLIPLMCIHALTDQRLPVYGDGKNVRDWIYVEDHCRAIDCILSTGKIGEVYNIGGNEEKDNLSIVHSILKLTGKDDSLIEYVKDRAGHDRRYAINPSKMMNELGWQPQVTFDEGLSGTIEWYKSNEDWWNNILSGNYRKDNDAI